MTTDTLDPITREQSILAALREQFPDVVAVTPGVALRVLGVTNSRDPDTAARQAIRRDTFPFPVAKLSGRKVVLLVDMARVLSSAQASS